MLEPWRITTETLVLAFIVWWITSVVDILIGYVEDSIEDDSIE